MFCSFNNISLHRDEGLWQIKTLHAHSLLLSCFKHHTLSFSFSLFLNLSLKKVLQLVWLLLFKKERKCCVMGVPVCSCETGRGRVLGMWGHPSNRVYWKSFHLLRREEAQKHEAFFTTESLNHKDNPFLQSSPNKLDTFSSQELKCVFY